MKRMKERDKGKRKKKEGMRERKTKINVKRQQGGEREREEGMCERDKREEMGKKVKDSERNSDK